MIRYRQLQHKFVDDVPEQLEPGILYVSMRYATALHLCCCGCRREVVTPFSPAQWRLTFDGETVSIHPSIGSWNVACRSHYIIKNGRVIEAEAWTDEEVALGQARDRRARAAHYRTKEVGTAGPVKASLPKPQKAWWSRINDFLAGR